MINHDNVNLGNFTFHILSLVGLGTLPGILGIWACLQMRTTHIMICFLLGNDGKAENLRLLFSDKPILSRIEQFNGWPKKIPELFLAASAEELPTHQQILGPSIQCYRYKKWRIIFVGLGDVRKLNSTTTIFERFTKRINSEQCCKFNSKRVAFRNCCWKRESNLGW